MTVFELGRRDFLAELAKYFTPAKPISSIEHLVGRQKLFQDATAALLSMGRHVFVFGDRGVGKTSLAQTAAYSMHSSSSDPILVACNDQLTFFQFMSDVLNAAIEGKSEKRLQEIELSLNLGPITAKFKQALETNTNVEVKSLNSAIKIFKFIAALNDQKAIIVIDEFDRMPMSERGLFSDIVKQVSDQEIGVKFIFCGVAETLDEFVGFHSSAGRYVFTIHLHRLEIDNRKEIVAKAYEKLGIIIDSNFLTRVAQISDGFPYFIHLIGEQIALKLYDAEKSSEYTNTQTVDPTVNHQVFDDGIKSAVAASEAFLKRQYENALNEGNGTHNEIILWSVADYPTLSRKVGEIYNNSYLSLCDQCKEEPLEIDRFRERLAKIRNGGSNVLVSKRKGWCEFSENMMRGYVRMRAMAAGVHLTPDHHSGSRRRLM